MVNISVCIASFNGEKFIARQLESILNQLGENDELIISDDSSKDDTIHIIKLFNDKRIKLLEKNKFYNPVFNFENALKHAKGRYIFLSDQDDIWIDGKVNACLQYLKDYHLVVSDCSVIDEQGNQIEKSFFRLKNSKPGFIRNLFSNSYIGCCMAFNRKVLEKALPFPKNIAMHDIWIGLIAELIGKTYFIDQKLVLYRRHAENITSTTQRSIYTINYRINYRIILCYHLLKKLLFK